LIIWLVRALVLVAGPMVAYFQIARTTQGLLTGLAVSVCVIIAEIIVKKIPLDTLVAAALGVTLGLIGAKMLDYTVFLTDNTRLYEIMKNYSLLIKIVFAYFGLVIAVQKKNELDLLDKDILGKGRRKGAPELVLLDTSAIIDGRIADIVATKFISGTLVIPRFVLEELQKLADSSDAHKRQRARRGLDIIAQMQKEENLSIMIHDKDYPDLVGADAKLLQFGKEIQAKIVTTDFNLNKVASLHCVTVLNPVYLPGENMAIFVVKEGKESNQGVGYLEDGTMVVVEDGRKHIGKRMEVLVTSILQTSSGRMVFTKALQEFSQEIR